MRKAVRAVVSEVSVSCTERPHHTCSSSVEIFLASSKRRLKALEENSFTM